jgi:hypothetical protein
MVVLSFNHSKLLLDITHGLFILPAFLDILKEGIPLALSFPVNRAAELFVLWMFRCASKGSSESLSLVEQGTKLG